jgi:hypothetical protein
MDGISRENEDQNISGFSGTQGLLRWEQEEHSVK